MNGKVFGKISEGYYIQQYINYHLYLKLIYDHLFIHFLPFQRIQDKTLYVEK